MIDNIDMKKTAESIIEVVGGKDNIEVVSHCLTRLRIVLKDASKVNNKALSEITMVKGSFFASGQLQIIIGAGIVDKLCDEVTKILGMAEITEQDIKMVASEKKKGNFLQRGISAIAEIFIPILPAIVTAGLLLGINNILANPGVFYEGKSFIDVHPAWNGLANIILVLATTSFIFLPALISWSAIKKFGGSQLLGIVFGISLVHPSLLSQWDLPSAIVAGNVPTWNLFGLTIDKVGYQGQVLPVLFAAYVLAKIEIFLLKHVPEMLKFLVVFPVSLLATGLLTFIVIGPIALMLSGIITKSIVYLFAISPIIGGAIYGVMYAPLVITGMHNIFLAVDLQLIGTTGATFLWPVLALSNIAQGTAAFAMFVLIKNKNAKGLPLTSGVSAWLGITEPAMFGVNLRFKFPFIAAILSTSLAGAFIMANGVKAQSIGIGGIPAFLSILNSSWGVFFIGMAIVIVVPFTLTYLLALLPKNKAILLDEKVI